MFDFTVEGYEQKLPTAGSHQAVIADIRISDGDDATYMSVTYELASGHVVNELVTIKADETSPRYADVGRGITRITELAKATSTPLDTLTDEEAIMSAFIGGGVTVVIALPKKAGIKRPTIRLVMAPVAGSEPKE